jgi:hypothetical protein
MGRSVFAWSTRPASGQLADVGDWRFMEGGKADQHPHSIPDDLKQRCFQLMNELNISFGCFDFALTDRGEYVFFEVNQGGQFLYGDHPEIGHSQLQAFAEFLISGRADFKYRVSPGALSLRHFLAEADYKLDLEQESKVHYGDFLRFDFARVAVEF